MLPNLEDYQLFEQEEVQRNIKAISKSDRHMKMMREMQKIKERQIRAEIEEKKEQKIPRGKPPMNRKVESKPRSAPRSREPLTDRRYRQSKRQRLEETKQELNMTFKIKQLSSLSAYPCNPKPGERIIQKYVLETNEKLCLKQLTKFIKLKATTSDLQTRNISYFVRGKDNRSKFDKITSDDTSLKELRQAYWPDEKMQSIYFMV